MTKDSRLTVDGLIIRDSTVVHISRHQVTPDEVLQAFEGDYANEPTHDERQKVVGATNSGRCLTIIIAPTTRPNYYELVTARTADRRERHLYITHRLGGEK